MLLDDLELVVVERAGLLQDRVRDRELADVVQQAADRQVAEPSPREPELLTDLDGEGGDATRVLLGRAVLLGEPHHESRARGRRGTPPRPTTTSDGTEISDKRPRRLAAAAQVVGNGCSDEADPEQLEEVTDPPAEIHERQREGAEERAREEDEPDHDGEIGGRAG